MAIKYGFFNSVNGDRKYSADDISNYFLKLISNGVFNNPSNNLQVTPNSDMTVQVSAGWGFINCKWVNNDGALLLDIDAADLVLDRIDRIVLRLNPAISARNITIDVKKGTAATSPTAPSLTRTEDGIWELSLAQIYIAAGATAITSANITDERADENVCGYVTFLVSQSSADHSIYYCNGINDNIMLMQYIANWENDQSRNGTIYVAGKFGVNGTTTAGPDGNAYSFVYNNTTQEANVTLDFSQCDTISARGCSFGYFGGCNVQGLSINYDSVTPSGGSAIVAIAGVNSTFEDCNVYGAIITTAVNVTAYSLDNCRLFRCDANLENLGIIYGISAEATIIDGCSIAVTSTGTEYSAYGVDISDASRCDNSIFQATTAATSSSSSASGGIGGGYYSNCLFIGLGDLKGQGFYVRSGNLLNANNCIFRGYTKDTEDGWGIGLTGAANTATTLILTGINCNQVAVTGYSQTASMTFAQGYGSFMGCFYTAVSVPSTIVSYGSFNRNRV